MKTLSEILKFVLKNWIPIAFAVLVVVLFADKSCDEAAFRKDIAVLDEDVTELEKKNVKLEDEGYKYIKDAEANEKVVADLKVVIAESKSKIEELEREEVEVETIVAALPVALLIKDTKMILECAEIELTNDGILFSIECTRSNLAKLKAFSLIRRQLDETAFALSTAEEALHFSERRSWNLYGALWKMGDQIINYRAIGKIKDQKYDRSEKQRKKSWFNGLFIGFAIGAGITVTIVIVIPLIRLIL